MRVRLKDGTEFIDKFWGSKGNWRFFKSGRKIRQADIKSFVIWKGDNLLDKKASLV